jgi:uncharacterized membrane protein
MDVGKSSTGMDANVAAGLSLVFGWISGLIFFLIEKDSKFVKFYAFQAIMLSLLMVVAGVFNVIPVLGQIVFIVVAVGVLILWIVCLINAFTGKIFKIPVLGEVAARQAGM